MASAVSTRILVLGVVCLFEPVNGYQVRRELQSWGVEDWSDLKPGSVYSMLSTLERQGLLTRYDLPDGSRSVAVYTTTGDGRRLFADLVRHGIDGTLGLDLLTLETALAFMPLLARRDATTALRGRRTRLEQSKSRVQRKYASGVRDSTIPPHVAHLLTLDEALRTSEIRWVDDLVQIVESGAMRFAGEAGAEWAPPAEDAGWEMVEQSKRYKEQISARKG